MDQRHAWSSGCHFKYVVLPGRNIQIKALRVEFVAVAFVLRVAQKIAQTPLPAAKVREREADAALAGMTSIIDGDQQPRAAGILPGRSDELVG